MKNESKFWIDQGGTFTDCIEVKNGRISLSKRLTHQFSLNMSGDIRKGTTVATNAILELKGAQVLLITNKGLGEVWDIGDQRRDELFDLYGHRKHLLRAQVHEIEGRISSQGAVLDEIQLSKEEFEPYLERGFSSAAVVLVHGPKAPQEELFVAAFLKDIGFSQVSVGHQVTPSRGFWARLKTTIADASLSPLLPREPALYMRSDGGLADHNSIEWSGAKAALSGPAGGAVAVEHLCKSLGIEQAFGFDMGGTSTDLCHYNEGIQRASELNVGGWLLRVPSIQIKTVAAGGGSVLFSREGLLGVGPESVGSSPGPASYGRGGKASLTDAEVVLGRVVHFPNICGESYDLPLDVAAARKAIGQLMPEQKVEDISLQFQEVAVEKMAGAILKHAAEKGVSPGNHTLIAFGGAGPAHACRLAERLGVRQVVVPILAGGFSALGIGRTSRRFERIVSFSWNEPNWDWVEAIVAHLRERSIELIQASESGWNERIDVRLRYKGTGEGLWVNDVTENGFDDVLNDFNRMHKKQLGYVQDVAVDWVEMRWVCEERNVHEQIDIEPLGIASDKVRVYFNGWKMVPCLSWEDSDGLVGPAVVLLHGSTLLIEDGWHVELGEEALILTQNKIQRKEFVTHFHPAQTAIFGHRIMAIAEQMGERLARLARSVSIRERRDFSCAVFDADGALIANAPHVPVHLGAMGETIERLLALKGDEVTQGTVWMSNDPYEGGSHLPDITVMMPVYWKGERVAFVANRGHHIDVGGVQPGSMPPFSKSILEEGFLVSQELLFEGDFLNLDVSGSRQPDEVWADLQAQCSACIFGAEQVRVILSLFGPEVCKGQFQALQEHAERVARSWIQQNEGVYCAGEWLDAAHEEIGLAVQLKVSTKGSELKLEAAPSMGNLNTPRAVVRASLLYVLRSLVKEDIPLNAGFLKPWRFLCNEHGLFDPVFPRAVVAGNVETSQRIVDSIVRALSVQAASQGTMNNLTIGTRSGALYETIAGGAGAGPNTAGGSAVQVHMTNTRATDIEELEHRFPLRILCWHRRRESGGLGKNRGGDGVVKEWLFLDEAKVAFLATRRKQAASGVEGGEPGAVGVDLCDRGHGWEAMPSVWTAKRGDKMRIETPGGGGYGRKKTRRG